METNTKFYPQTIINDEKGEKLFGCSFKQEDDLITILYEIYNLSEKENVLYKLEELKEKMLDELKETDPSTEYGILFMDAGSLSSVLDDMIDEYEKKEKAVIENTVLPHFNYCKGQDAFGGINETSTKKGKFYCGECGYTFNRRFKICPKCGSTLHWITWEEYGKMMDKKRKVLP